jgi:hypothetical protein
VRGVRVRALAVPLEHSPSPRGRPRRRWYRPAREPLPSEPGRLVVCALLSRARRARGCVTPGDDRLETRAYAVKRYLFRLGHAARSARFATSTEQLVMGLAPVMGWGAVPRGNTERARFVRAHRKSVQRWLDDLRAAGVVAHEPERDEHGRWWRTQVVLLDAPQPAREELRAAGERARGWRARERARRRRRRPSRLAGIRARAAVPRRDTRVPGDRRHDRRDLHRGQPSHQRRPRGAAWRAAKPTPREDRRTRKPGDRPARARGGRVSAARRLAKP